MCSCVCKYKKKRNSKKSVTIKVRVKAFKCTSALKAQMNFKRVTRKRKGTEAKVQKTENKQKK